VDQQQFEQLTRILSETRLAEILNLIVLGLGIAVAVISLLYVRKQLLADHGRSQRQLAHEMCSRWSTFTSPETASVTRLIEKMTADQCEALANFGTLVIAAEHKHHLITILQLRFPDFETKLETVKNGQSYRMDGQYLLYMRHIAVRYLNMLESILLCWTMSIADQGIIEREFSYLFNEGKNRTALEGFRKKLGAEGFPAIEQFMQALRAQARSENQEIERPAPLG
jgi:hypothetical protein